MKQNNTLPEDTSWQHVISMEGSERLEEKPQNQKIKTRKVLSNESCQAPYPECPAFSRAREAKGLGQNKVMPHLCHSPPS